MNTSFLTPPPVDRSLHNLEESDFEFLEKGRLIGAEKGRMLREFLNIIRSVPNEVPRKAIEQSFGTAILHCFEKDTFR